MKVLLVLGVVAGLTTSGTGAVVDCTHGVWQNLEACGWPGPTNTGPDLAACGGSLTNVTGPVTLNTPNATYSCKNVTGGINVTAQNVTIQNSIVSYANNPTGIGAGGSGVININDGASATVDHVELNGLNHTHACIWDEGVKGAALPYSMVAKNVNCHNVNDGIFSWWWASDRNAGAGSDFIIQDSYFHDFTFYAANGHVDGYQTEGAQNGTITHNTYLILRDPNDAGTQTGANLDSAIAIWDSFNGTSTGLTSGHFTISNNLFGGQPGFVSYAEDYSGGTGYTGGNVVIDVKYTNNSFSNYWQACTGVWGAWYTLPNNSPYFGGPTDLWNQGGSLRSGNTVLETGENIDTGGPTGCQGHNSSPPPPGPRPPTGLTALVQ